jgi:hypothetical protein
VATTVQRYAAAVWLTAQCHAAAVVDLTAQRHDAVVVPTVQRQAAAVVPAIQRDDVAAVVVPTMHSVIVRPLWCRQVIISAMSAFCSGPRSPMPQIYVVRDCWLMAGLLQLWRELLEYLGSMPVLLANLGSLPFILVSTDCIKAPYML